VVTSGGGKESFQRGGGLKTNNTDNTYNRSKKKGLKLTATVGIKIFNSLTRGGGR